MNCPACNRPIPDGSFECPWCGEAVSSTQQINVADVLERSSWCPVCGALLSPGDESCPKCGSPVSTPTPAPEEVPEVEEEPAESAFVLESAIPPTGADADTPSAAPDVMPRMRRLIFAAVVAVVVVGGAALWITHPWDPNANDTRATVPYDTSNAGFPGEVDSLNAQDKSGEDDSQDAETSGDPIYDYLATAYENLGTYAASIDASEESLKTTGVSGSSEERSQGLKDLEATSIAVSNVISGLGSLADSNGAYANDISNLKSLGNWLRNRCDALDSSWEVSAASDDPAASKDAILAPLLATYGSDGQSAYKTLFDENYASWKPALAGQ